MKRRISLNLLLIVAASLTPAFDAAAQTPATAEPARPAPERRVGVRSLPTAYR